MHFVRPFFVGEAEVRWRLWLRRCKRRANEMAWKTELMNGSLTDSHCRRRPHGGPCPFPAPLLLLI